MEPHTPHDAQAVARERRRRRLFAGLNLACVGAWVVIIGAFLLPPQGAGIPICPSKAITGVPCPGCGLTRSVCNLVRGDFAAAMRYNPFGWVALAIAAWYAAAPLLRRPFRDRVQRSRLVRVAGLIFLFVFVAHGVVRAAFWIGGDRSIAAGE